MPLDLPALDSEIPKKMVSRQRSRQSGQDGQVPSFDAGGLSKRLCIGGLAFCWLVGIASLTIGVYLVRIGDVDVEDSIFPIPAGIATSFNKYTQELAPLGLNILVTVCNDIIGYMHTVSLRWALQKEERLIFSSNLRLFTSARQSTANAWYTNFIMAIFMVMSYASTPLLFIRAANEGLPANANAFICGYAAITLAIAILGQAAIASLFLPSLVKVPTWSSDPLELTAACIRRGSLYRRPGRCMRSVRDLEKPAQPISPSHRQPPATLVHSGVFQVCKVMWVTVVLALVWCGFMYYATTDSAQEFPPGRNWSFFPNIGASDLDDQTRYLATNWNPGNYFNLDGFCLAFTVIGIIQAVMTLSLHCAELLVNRIRDERSWREASKEGHRSLNALRSMLSSSPALVLFIFKSVIHWLYSLAISVDFFQGLNMRIPQIFYLAVGAIFLAVFVTTCASWKLKGPQPAAFGHLQTLADLVDVWPNVGESMFWGQKNPPWLPTGSQINVWQGELDPLESLSGEDALLRDNGHISHAGTSAERLEPVDFSRKYMGLARWEDFCLS